MLKGYIIVSSFYVSTVLSEPKKNHVYGEIDVKTQVSGGLFVLFCWWWCGLWGTETRLYKFKHQCL